MQICQEKELILINRYLYYSNNFKMQALKGIPKVLDGIQDIRHPGNAEKELSEYKKNVRKFIQNLTEEVNHLILKYQSTIATLTQQNARLKQRPAPLKEFNQIRQRSRSQGRSRSKSPFKVQEEMESPIKKFKGLDMMQTAKSTMFTPHKVGNLAQGPRFSSVLAKYQSNNDEDNNFPIELINPEPVEEDFRKSRFAAKSQVKKQREEQLRHFLQTGKKNLNHTTERFLSAVGKNKKEEEVPQLQLKRDGSDSSLKSKNNESHNKSLGNICESMDNSFVSRQARSKNKKKRQQQMDEAEKKKKRDEELNKMLKDKGIKNLLSRLRDNVENSAKRPPQVITNSKLLSCGPKNNKSPVQKQQKQAESVQSPTRKNSKVLINPVPVDIGKKSQLMRRQTMSPTISPEKKPTSILKQSSSVLTRSISGISAIDFNI